MKVVETIECYGEEGDSRVTVSITLDNGETKSVSFGEGEPEDMYLFRDLSDAYDISDLVSMAYNAGLNNEKFEFIKVKEED